MEFLHQDGLVHEAVPVDPGFHVAFPFVEAHIMAGEELETVEDSLLEMRLTWLALINNRLRRDGSLPMNPLDGGSGCSIHCGLVSKEL